VLRGTAGDRANIGDWAGVAVTGIGGIGKTALAGRIIARARADGWKIDPGFAELFAILLDNTRTGRVLTTCHYPVPDTADALLRLDLPPLTPAEQRRLYLRLPALRALSVDDRRLVTRTIGGHPRLIEFVDVLLREAHQAASGT
jgi:hypothetical protein